RTKRASGVDELDAIAFDQFCEPPLAHFGPESRRRLAIVTGSQADPSGSEQAAKHVALWPPAEHGRSRFDRARAHLGASQIGQERCNSSFARRTCATIAAQTDASSCAQLMRAQSIPRAIRSRTSP